MNITVLRTFGVASEFRYYKDYAALPLDMQHRKKMQVQPRKNGAGAPKTFVARMHPRKM